MTIVAYIFGLDLELGRICPRQNLFNIRCSIAIRSLLKRSELWNIPFPITYLVVVLGHLSILQESFVTPDLERCKGGTKFWEHLFSLREKNFFLVFFFFLPYNLDQWQEFFLFLIFIEIKNKITIFFCFRILYKWSFNSVFH